MMYSIDLEEWQLETLLRWANCVCRDLSWSFDAAPNPMRKRQLEEAQDVRKALYEGKAKMEQACLSDGKTMDHPAAPPAGRSCEGCMYFDYERDERPCCECSRLPGRVDRYVEEDETLADAFPSLHEEVAKT